MYRTVAQIDAVTESLAASYPTFFSRIALPERSVQGRTVFALRLRPGTRNDRVGVLAIGGVHARELMNPDALVELATDLFTSYRNGTSITYGSKTWTASQVRAILEAREIWLVPCTNPDGRQHVMTVDDLWRKNRRDNPGTTCDGVDLNRNTAILWGVTQGQTSCSPCAGVFCGPTVFSEPETRNVKSLLDTQRIDCFVDVHSYSELVLHPWGHAPTQSTDSTKRFTALPSGTCKTIAVSGYQEYMSAADLRRFRTMGQAVVDAIAAVRGRRYTLQAGIALYPTTGTHGDYAWARHIANSSLRRTYGYTMETGPYTGDVRTSFHPPDPTLVKRDTKAGLLALVQYAGTRVPDVRELGRTAASSQVTAADLRPVFSGSTAGDAYVASQSPAAGTVVARGTNVALSMRPGPIP